MQVDILFHILEPGFNSLQCLGDRIESLLYSYIDFMGTSVETQGRSSSRSVSSWSGLDEANSDSHSFQVSSAE